MIQDLLVFLNLSLFSKPPHHLKTQSGLQNPPAWQVGPGRGCRSVSGRGSEQSRRQNGRKTGNDHLSLRRSRETSVARLRFTPAMPAPVVSRENTTGGWKIMRSTCVKHASVLVFPHDLYVFKIHINAVFTCTQVQTFPTNIE